MIGQDRHVSKRHTHPSRVSKTLRDHYNPNRIGFATRLKFCCCSQSSGPAKNYPLEPGHLSTYGNPLEAFCWALDPETPIMRIFREAIVELPVLERRDTDAFLPRQSVQIGSSSRTLA